MIIIQLFNIYLQWESFSIPELTNFLLILDMEYNEQLRLTCNKYTSYKRNLETRLNELKPLHEGS